MLKLWIQSKITDLVQNNKQNVHRLKKYYEVRSLFLSKYLQLGMAFLTPKRHNDRFVAKNNLSFVMLTCLNDVFCGKMRMHLKNICTKWKAFKINGIFSPQTLITPFGGWKKKYCCLEENSRQQYFFLSQIDYFYLLRQD